MIFRLVVDCYQPGTSSTATLKIALLTHCSPKKNRASNCARRLHQAYPGTGCLLKQVVQGRLLQKGMISGWVPREFTKKQLPKIWKHPRENHFAVDSRFSGGVTHKKTFPSCELSLPVDGSKGDMIHFLGELQPYGCGRLMLLSQLQVLSEQDTNPFECTSSDSEEVYPTLYLLDSDHKEDSYMKLSELCSLYFALSIAVVLTCKLWKRERAMEHVFVFKIKWLLTILLFSRNKLDFK